MFNALKLRTLALTVSLAALGATPALAAAAHTVPWYLSNTSVRTTTLATCNADPGDLARTPDCINARAAEQYAMDSVL
jgi:hypothetical protein